MRSTHTILVSVLGLAGALTACDRDFMSTPSSAGTGRERATTSTPIVRDQPVIPAPNAGHYGQENAGTPSAEMHGDPSAEMHGVPGAEMHGQDPMGANEEAMGNPALPTAQDQPMTEAEAETTRLIREAVVDDADLSMGARNVVIVTRGHVVTLRGDVSSDDERDTVEAHARAVAGVDTVDNRLTVRL